MRRIFRRFFRHPARAAGTLATLAAAATILVGQISATFTSTVPAGPQTISSGSLIIGTGVNDSTIGAANIAPGDTVPREFALNSTSSTINAASITLKFSASPSTLLDTDATWGLQLNINECSVQWTRTTPTPPPVAYTCSGSTTAILINGLTTMPVSTLEGTAEPLTTLQVLTPAKNDDLEFVYTFPSGAPGDTSKVPTVCSGTPGGSVTTEDLQGCSSTLSYVLLATQRAAAPQ